MPFPIIIQDYKLTTKLRQFFFFREKKNHLLAQKPAPQHNDTPKTTLGFLYQDFINHKNQKYVEKGKGQFERPKIGSKLEGI